jgi:hypothetical protein
VFAEVDERGMRAQRLVRCVWELAAKGVFAPGEIAAELVVPVAYEQQMMCRMAAGVLRTERDASNVGFKLHAFFGYLYDGESEHREVLARAACALSWFSCEELEAAFDTRSDILRGTCRDLSLRTRAKMTYPVDSSYKTFATDALAYTLPLIEMRRNALGVDRPWLRPSAAADVLRTVPRVCGWRPEHGELRLGVADLRGAHPSARAMLDRLHAGGVLVRRRGGGKGNRAIVYAFDTVSLYRVMSSTGIDSALC